MKNHTCLFRMLSAMTIVLAIGGTAAETEPTQTLYAAGTQATFVGPEKLFTGDVFVEMLFPSNATANFSGAYVTFQPGARTAWHLHPGGQHMIVTDGTALTGTRDGTVLAFHEGETVWCPPDIDHWHGATPDAPMTHLVITGVKDSKNVIWKEKVTDEQYYTGKYQKKGDPMTAIESLTPQQQAIIPIAAFTANGDQEPLKIAVQAGLDAGLTVNEIKEVMVQLYAYAGFPRSLNALATCMTVVNERKAQGIEDETGKEASPLPEDKSVLELGTEVQTQLAGRPVAGPLFDFAPVANEYLQAHLFGDIFGRDVLGFQDRELATVAALASMTGVEPQLNAHVGMAANAGVTHQQLVDLVTVLKNKVGEPEGQRAEEAMNK